MRQTPFEMSDWKMKSIFVGWIFLLLVTSLVFLIEIRFSVLKMNLDRSAIIWGVKKLAMKPILLLKYIARNSLVLALYQYRFKFKRSKYKK